jgi:hypothetical protein
VNQLAVSAILSDLPEDDAWVRALLERRATDWILRYGLVTVGRQPATWPGESWVYESVAFVASTIPIATLVESVSSSDGTLPLGEFTISLPPVQSVAQSFHRPSFELHDRERSPQPSFEYAINAEGGPGTQTSTAGRSDFLICPDSPSFRDLDSAYRAFFLGSYEVPANAAVPSELLHIRVTDERAWLGPIHITATQMTVEVRGNEVAGTALEYFSPTRWTRLTLDGADVVTIELPDGLPASNTWL